MSRGKQIKPELKRNPQQETFKISADERYVDYEVELHFHDYIEIELIIDGQGEQIFNGKRTPFERGVVSVFRLADYHYFMPREPITLLNISFNPDLISAEMLQRLDGASSRICTQLSGEDYTAIEALMRLVIAEYQKGNIDMRYMRHLIECIFIKLLGLEMFQLSSARTFPIQQAIAYLRAHFSEDPTVDTVAKMLHYHPKHFSAIFNKEVGMTFSKYLTKLKITYAKTLLRITDLDMESICSSCGFGSMVNFRRVFKEYTGVPPLQYRKNNKGVH